VTQKSNEEVLLVYSGSSCGVRSGDFALSSQLGALGAMLQRYRNRDTVQERVRSASGPYQVSADIRFYISDVLLYN